MFNKNSLAVILKELESYRAQLVAVSKTKPVSEIKEVFDSGQKIFGENYVQEVVEKHRQLPMDIEWHFIGHLQTNKVKHIAPFVSMVQSVDSLNLLNEINKEGKKHDRIIPCLLQIHIAKEETKFGFSFNEVEELLNAPKMKSFENININGFMAMATLTDDKQQIKNEFRSMKLFYDKIKNCQLPTVDCQLLSMGMTSDYQIALEEGSTMVRIGSAIFGER